MPATLKLFQSGLELTALSPPLRLTTPVDTVCLRGLISQRWIRGGTRQLPFPARPTLFLLPMASTS